MISTSVWTFNSELLADVLSEAQSETVVGFGHSEDSGSKLERNALRDNLWWFIVWYLVHQSNFLKAPGLKIIVLPNWVWF